MAIPATHLPCPEFGRQLIATGDLDPVYIALTRANLDTAMLARICVAYWCLYSLGSACRVTEARGKAFWPTLLLAAHNEDRSWQRGSERRHWRGQAAHDSAVYLAANFKDAGALVAWLADGATFKGVTDRAKTIVGFGPWIAFKIADMLERVLGYPVDFNGCSLGFYDEPRKGAALYLTGCEDSPVRAADVASATAKLISEIGPRIFAPPLHDRYINVQEAETVFCKWKSHVKGHYPVGKDIVEVRHSLALADGMGGQRQRLAGKLWAAMPPEVK